MSASYTDSNPLRRNTSQLVAVALGTVFAIDRYQVEIPDPLVHEDADGIVPALRNEFAEGENIGNVLFIQETHLAGLAVRSGLMSFLDLLP